MHSVSVANFYNKGFAREGFPIHIGKFFCFSPIGRQYGYVHINIATTVKPDVHRFRVLRIIAAARINHS